MNDRTVYLVYGFDCYEYPYNPIKAFSSKADADALLGEIAAYQEQKPEYPSDNASDEEYDAWNAQLAQWKDSHPAGDAYGHDGFDVMPLPLVEAAHD
jgi:hypothetical protein